MIAVAISGLGLTLLLLRREELAQKRVRGLIRLLEYLRASVERCSFSVSELIRRCDPELLYICGYDGDGELPLTLVELYERCDTVDAEAGRIFYGLALDFGKSYRQRQIEGCTDSLERLRVRETELSAALPTRRRMILGVGVSLTLALIILLL
jgi:hypothetical protein